MANQLSWYNKTLKVYITQEELQQLMQKSDWRGAWKVAQAWLWIFSAFALVLIHVIFPSPAA